MDFAHPRDGRTPAVVKPPKTETFDVAARVNVDPKGFRRPVDTYRDVDSALYMARGSDHRDFGYLESLLLPAEGVRVNIFHRRPGSRYDFERYLDIADIVREDTPGGVVWRTRDLYLDVIVAGNDVRIEDADELAAATAAGTITPGEATWTIERAWHAAVGITAAGGDVDKWLATLGVDPGWLPPEDVVLVDEGAWA